MAKCRDCKAPVLAGLSEDWMAWVVTVDSSPLSPIGEMLAVLGGLRTYELRAHQQTLALWQRDRWQIRGRPPGVKFDVVADHQCEPVEFPTLNSVYPIPQKKEIDDEQCPY